MGAALLKNIAIIGISLVITACFDAPESKPNAESFAKQDHRIQGADLFIEQGHQLQIKMPVGSWISKDGFVYLSQVHDDAENIDLAVNQVVDRPTFNWLFYDVQDRKKVNNDYFLRASSMPYYFKDKNHIYIADPKVPTLSLVGDVRDYEVLGGAYLRVGSTVYYRGKKIVGADSQTFKTMNVMRQKSEWLVTLGLDKHYIYTGERPTSNYADFEFWSKDYIYGRAESLILESYFPQHVRSN